DKQLRGTSKSPQLPADRLCVCADLRVRDQFGAPQPLSLSVSGDDPLLLPRTALCFTCCWYSSIITVGLVYLLVAQVLSISFNVTGREAQLALRNKKGQSRLWGLVVDTGEHSRGFYQNWVEFLTMKDSSVSFHSSPTDLV
ncbi:hypothetical protein XENOCAPTIV_003141, partial [Xenoophorus captivus]